MGRVAGLLLLLPLAAIGAGCGAKKVPHEMSSRPTTPIPQSWEGVSFDEELADLGPDLGATTRTDDSCARPRELEPEATAGRLTADQIACIDHALRLARKQTTKDTLSRLILADAWAKADLHRWEGAARRHITEIDSSDPDVSYLLAVHLSKQGPASAFEAIRFAELALENHQRWDPDVHAERMLAMLRLRALSAAELWYHYEDELLVEKTPQTSAQVDRWRSATKANAREWLEFVWSAGQDPKVPYELCVSAAGTLAYCEIGFDEAASAED